MNGCLTFRVIYNWTSFSAVIKYAQIDYNTFNIFIKIDLLHHLSKYMGNYNLVLCNILLEDP